ncbi:hypothetical protein RSOL_222550 [Rhizoctonia solani AG-3 Rhs1AP]|uniref:Uncharacterized protein n=2 Tax=Rhizoctonia solani AG-3 TaxID=1086053 RepID=A0A074SKE9_9AGAM|nr:hypothetical protein RSOL_222550 [Rhizoctonia solani AG-3 Rhs1AP]KEP50542.1 hypothetical protein V565_078200 [Rhizoctonia solani 123E]
MYFHHHFRSQWMSSRSGILRFFRTCVLLQQVHVYPRAQQDLRRTHGILASTQALATSPLLDLGE